MRYVSVVGVLPTVGGSLRAPQTGEAAGVPGQEAQECAAVDRVSNNLKQSISD